MCAEILGDVKNTSTNYSTNKIIVNNITETLDAQGFLSTVTVTLGT